MQFLQVGMDVHVVAQNFEHRPAKIIEIVNDRIGYCVLRVFGKTYIHDYSITCSYSEKPEANSWHWPERT